MRLVQVLQVQQPSTLPHVYHYTHTATFIAIHTHTHSIAQRAVIALNPYLDLWNISGLLCSR
jgi:hypothetical protein